MSAAAPGPLPEKPPVGVCPTCRAATLQELVSLTTPLNMAAMLRTREEATAAARATVALVLCTTCGVISNGVFDAPGHDYSASYEETQAFSPRFLAYVDELVGLLEARHALDGREVLEIGCGRGEVIRALCTRTGALGKGVDPSIRDEHRDAAAADGVRLVRAFFDAPDVDPASTLVLCRHTLEHVHDVRSFLGRLHAGMSAAPEASAVFEVPDTMRILREGAFWDVFYEHCTYFTPGSLARAFRAAGFAPTDLRRVYDDQYILVEAKPGDPGGPALPGEEPAEEVVAEAMAFVARVADARASWRSRLAAVQAAGKTAVVWGAGSKGVAFLTALEVEREIACAVDVNPEKNGMFMPGTGHEIVSPERLVELRPDLAVVMNPVYVGEIEAQLRGLGLSTEIAAL